MIEITKIMITTLKEVLIQAIKNLCQILKK